MNRSTVANRWNLDLIEENYQRWRNDPASVDESWRLFFEGYELGQSGDGMARADVDHDAAGARPRSPGSSTATARSATTWPTSTP